MCYFHVFFSQPTTHHTIANQSLVRGTSLLLFSSSGGGPLLVNLDTGKFLDLPCGEDFSKGPVVVQNAQALTTSRYELMVYMTCSPPVSGTHLRSLKRAVWLWELELVVQDVYA
jgi:hypothetical protein